jgi:hypothetical protein
MNNPHGIWRLDIDGQNEDVRELSDALDRVIEQPCSATKGIHAELCWIMKTIFKRNFNKHDAVAGAIWSLWQDADILSVQSSDPYVMEIQQDERIERHYIEMAEAE